MKRCDWCNNPIEGGPFSNYCSRKCEKEAVSNGEKKGVRYSSGALGIIIIMAIYFSVKSFSSKTNVEPDQKVTEKNYSEPNNNEIGEPVRDEYVAETPERKSDTVSEDEHKDEVLQEKSLENNSQESNEITEKSRTQEEIAIDLLKKGKSIQEIMDATSLSRRDVKKIRTQLENN